MQQGDPTVVVLQREVDVLQVTCCHDMKELSFGVSNFQRNQNKCEIAAIRQGAVQVAMRQLEIILSVQATFTTHPFNSSVR